jgi:C4-type Zn-finger protein
MNCPVCGKQMTVETKDISTNHSNNKYYDRIIYWCEKDDAWINVELSQATNKP